MWANSFYLTLLQGVNDTLERKNNGPEEVEVLLRSAHDRIRHTINK